MPVIRDKTQALTRPAVPSLYAVRSLFQSEISLLIIYLLDRSAASHALRAYTPKSQSFHDHQVGINELTKVRMDRCALC